MGRQQSRIGIDGRHRFLSSCGGRASLRPVAQLLSIGGGDCMSAAGASSPMLVEPVAAGLVRYETPAVLLVVGGEEMDVALAWQAPSPERRSQRSGCLGQIPWSSTP